MPRALIRTVPDFPKQGIRFRDITPLLGDAAGFRAVTQQLAERYAGRVDKVAGIEARGFIFGAAVAQHLHAGFVPFRKPGKLPAAAIVECAFVIELVELGGRRRIEARGHRIHSLYALRESD